MTDAPNPAPVQQADVDRCVREADALIFDCDGTLLKTPELYAAAWQSAFAKAGLEMKLDWYHDRAGMSEHVLLDAFEAETGAAIDRAAAVRELRHFILAHIGSVEEIPEVAAIVRASHGQKPMAVAS
ncbi:MAG: HAD hydrolase-like protein, partial [Pseudomonadota bacterium]